MEQKTYNGWTNYETWNWKLWLDNDQGLHEYWQEQAADCLENCEARYDFESDRDAAISELSDRLESECEDMASDWMPDQASAFADLLNSAIKEINFREIAESLIEDHEG